jgi:hypothetical protein
VIAYGLVIEHVEEGSVVVDSEVVVDAEVETSSVCVCVSKYVHHPR